jgi:hypothetical protein
VSKAVQVAEKSHAELGASVANRWMNCPGSVQLSRTCPRPNTTEAADQGTAAHELAELCLRRGVDCEVYLGTKLNGVEVDDEMVENVQIFVDVCRQAAVGGSHTFIEHNFNLAKLNPPEPMFGTNDFGVLDGRTLQIFDLKYGAGVRVEVKGNKQLRYYALGAVLALSEYDIDDVVITIVQPRMAHPDGIIRSETVTLAELIEFSVELIDAAKATQQPGAELVPGDWCRFCPAKGVCPALLQQAQEIAQVEFGVVDVPPAPETLPPELFAEIHNKLPILEEWIKAMKATALARLERGEEVPGLKLVAKRANRHWKSEKEAEQYLRADGREDDEIFDKKMKSPAQIEKLVGKKNLPQDLVVKRSSGHAMVHAHDPRPPIEVTSGSEFFALPSGEDTE